MKDSLKKPIYNFTPFTLLDFPEHTACIVWFAGCNMECVYCYNPDIVFGKGKLSCDHFLNFLKTRIGMLDGVVLSGGECTTYKYLVSFSSEIKKMGFKIKVDTNGGNPKVLETLMNENLVDYVALDFKATSSKFYGITASRLFRNFEKSLDLLIGQQIPFEVRTTFHSSLLDEKDMKEMIHFLRRKNYTKKLYVQPFRNDVDTIGQIGKANQSKIRDVMKQLGNDVIVRN